MSATAELSTWSAETYAKLLDRIEGGLDMIRCGQLQEGLSKIDNSLWDLRCLEIVAGATRR
jgi:hypothetical protein